MLEATCVFAKTSNPKIKCSIKNYAGNRCSAIFLINIWFIYLKVYE